MRIARAASDRDAAPSDHGIEGRAMTMTPAVRRFALTAHITMSVSWIGAVLAFLALALVGLTSPDDLTVRGAYVVMEPAAWFVLVALAVASLLTGLVMSLGTSWGLFRHYWVLLKLLITIFAMIILLIYMGTFREMASVAADPSVRLELVRNPSPVLHAILALLILLTAAVLAIYKPLGMTPYGRRHEREQRQASSQATSPPRTPVSAATSNSTPLWVYFSGMVAIGVILLLVILHLLGGSPAHH
jgi:hypothetical protein